MVLYLVLYRTEPRCHTEPQSCCLVSTITEPSHHSREICSALCPSVTKVQVQALRRVIMSASRRQTGVGIICLQPLVLSCVGVIQGLWREMNWALLSPLSQSVQLIIHLLYSSLLLWPLSVLFSIWAQRSQLCLHLALFLLYLFTLSLLFCVKRGKTDDGYRLLAKSCFVNFSTY